MIAEAEEQRQRQMLIRNVEALQNMLLSQATDGYHPGTPQHDEDSELYAKLRREFSAHPLIRDRLPRFVSTCRDLTQFRRLMQSHSPHYRNRREHIYEAFRPVLDALEGRGTTPADADVGEVLASFDAEGVHRVWERALDRRKDDPEGAITMARTLLETVCKHILDDAGIAYNEKDDLPRLYFLTSNHLRLAPSLYADELKRIFGGCTSVVEGLGALRNRVGDAHGKGKKHAKPSPFLAEYAVNLAGASALFLVQEATNAV